MRVCCTFLLYLRIDAFLMTVQLFLHCLFGDTFLIFET